MKVTKWDMADYIETAEDVLIYLSTALEEGEPADVINVIGAIARSKGMTQLAKQIGVSREALYTSLSEKGNPSFSTVFNILRSMGITLQARRTVIA
ncbi:addiction module antidote protein [Treponema denticola]|uniref:addiction module antidote protein n=1 Tax=Treponema denticola TaxID=158 RepID=UPI0020A4ECAA|nr:addiction module antidote protein [Treponema denticola]UTC82948.1 putative addiction module antidote protein [Treponema denticola]